MDMFEEKDIYNEYPAEEKKVPKKKRVTVVIVCALVIALVAGAAFFGGVMYAKENSVEAEMPMVKTVIDALNRYYVDEIDWEELQYTIAKAIAGSIDPFTGLVEASPAGVQTMSMGITVASDERSRYYITQIDPGSPAAEAYNILENSTGTVRLQVGDEIVSINGQDVRNLNYNSFSYILANAGDIVEIYTNKNHGNGIVTQHKYIIEKKLYHTPYAYYLGSDVTGLPSDTGYIKLKQFGDTAPDDFYAAVNAFLSDENSPNKLVLDLRGNGGGSTAICGYIASFFIKQNGSSSGIPLAKYVYNEGGGDMAETYFYTQDTYVSDYDGSTLPSVNLYDRVEDFECVLLVNGNSASSSELLTATLGYYCGIKTVGEQTYGKGVAQIVLTYNNKKYELYITNGKYYIPSEKDGKTVFETNIHGVGLTPDVAADASGIYYMAKDPCFIAAADLLSAD